MLQFYVRSLNRGLKRQQGGTETFRLDTACFGLSSNIFGIVFSSRLLNICEWQK